MKKEKLEKCTKRAITSVAERETPDESAVSKERTVIYSRTLLYPIKEGGRVISVARITTPTLTACKEKCEVLDVACPPRLSSSMEYLYGRLNARCLELLSSKSAPPRSNIDVDFKASVSKKRDKLIIIRRIRSNGKEEEQRDVFSLKSGELIG